MSSQGFSQQKQRKVTIEPLPVFPHIVLALNLLDTTPPRFHWLLFVADDEQEDQDPDLQKGLKLHAVYRSNAAPGAQWSFDSSICSLATSQSVAAAAIIGQLKDKDRDELVRILSLIPMSVPAVDSSREAKFSCRVWIREALRRMHAERFIQCPNVDAMEQEMWELGTVAAEQIENGTFDYARLTTAVHSHTQ